jgi:hypothetical protein
MPAWPGLASVELDPENANSYMQFMQNVHWKDMANLRSAAVNITEKKNTFFIYIIFLPHVKQRTWTIAHYSFYHGYIKWKYL